MNNNRCNLDQSEFLIVLNENTIGGLQILSNDTKPTNIIPSNLPLADDLDKSDLSTGELALSAIVRESGFLWDRLVPVNDVSFGYDFTYDFKEQNIYWLEHNRSTYSLNIHRVKFDGENREIFVSSG